MERTAARHKELMREKDDEKDIVMGQKEQYKLAYVEKSFLINVIRS
jgi:hypothetical protein